MTPFSRSPLRVLSRYLSVVAGLLFAAAACQGGDIASLRPDIVVCVPPDTGPECDAGEAPRLIFPVVPARGTPAEQAVVVRNIGEAPLFLPMGETRIGGGAEAFTVSEAPDMLPALGGRGEVLVSFLPATPNQAIVGELIIKSNDPDQGDLTVRLEGTSGDVANPAVVVCLPPDTAGECSEPEELEIDLGPLLPGRTKGARLTLRSTGNTPAAVSVVSPPPPFNAALVGASEPEQILAPGETINVDADFAPTMELEGEVETILEIHTNEVGREIIEVKLKAFVLTSGKPRARAFEKTTQRSNVRVVPPLRVELVGSESVDPENGLLEYKWDWVEWPQGFIPELLPDDTTADVAFNASFIGTYVVDLTVTDPELLTDTDRVTITAAPQKDLYVQLTWQTHPDAMTTTRKDVDLHIVRLPAGSDDGTALLWTAEDCYHKNCRPLADPMAPPRDVDWGASCGDCEGNDRRCQDACREDNPVLAIDTIEGTEPEVTWLNNPDPEGRYAVYAHMFATRRVVATQASVLVSLQVAEDETRIFRVHSDAALNGNGDRESDCGMQNLDTGCHLWFAGIVDWAQKSFTPACNLERVCEPSNNP